MTRAEIDAQLKLVRGLAVTFRDVPNQPQVVWASLQNLITMVLLLPEQLLATDVLDRMRRIVNYGLAGGNEQRDYDEQEEGPARENHILLDLEAMRDWLAEQH